MFAVLNSIPLVWAVPQAESARVLEQAQSLILKKQRASACAKLQDAISSLPPSAKSQRAKLLAALNQYARMFFTDKGQKAFEAGQSMMFESPDLALSQFRDVLNLEDANQVVLTSMAKIHLMKQDCEGAKAALDKARAMNPYSAEPALLEIRTLICQQHFELVREKAKAVPPMDKWEEQYLQYLLAQDLIRAKSAKKALEMLSRVAEEQPQFPEAYFYLARAGADLNREGSEFWLNKYALLCKTVSGKERRRFSLEPKLCGNLKEVEDELAKKGADN